MKRSSHLRLSLMTLAVPVALGGCESAETGRVLASAADCATTPIRVPVEQCLAAYDTALAEHARVAPRFESARDCQEQFGACTTMNDAAGSFFIPAMGGFLLGYAATRDDDRGASGGYLYRYGGAAPLYVDRKGRYYTAAGDRLRRGDGAVKGRKGVPSTPARAVTVSRSGFGSTASARSSFGG